MTHARAAAGWGVGSWAGVTHGALTIADTGALV